MFCQIYGIMSSFVQIKEIFFFGGPNLWNYVQFFLNYGIPPLMFTFELRKYLTFGICKYLTFGIFDIWHF
jgi:hypothetical protein